MLVARYCDPGTAVPVVHIRCRRSFPVTLVSSNRGQREVPDIRRKRRTLFFTFHVPPRSASHCPGSDHIAAVPLIQTIDRDHQPPFFLPIGHAKQIQLDVRIFASSFTNPTVADSLGFTGREFDDETGLYYFRARYYNPDLGRFQSEDPIGMKNLFKQQLEGTTLSSRIKMAYKMMPSQNAANGLQRTSFAAGDFNASRYVGNDPTDYLDSKGTVPNARSTGSASEYVLVVEASVGEATVFDETYPSVIVEDVLLLQPDQLLAEVIAQLESQYAPFLVITL